MQIFIFWYLISENMKNVINLYVENFKNYSSADLRSIVKSFKLQKSQENSGSKNWEICDFQDCCKA